MVITGDAQPSPPGIAAASSSGEVFHGSEYDHEDPGTVTETVAEPVPLGIPAASSSAKVSRTKKHNKIQHGAVVQPVAHPVPRGMPVPSFGPWAGYASSEHEV